MCSFRHNFYHPGNEYREIIIIFIANKILAGKAIQYKTYIHEQHKEMSYIHS